MLVLKWAIYPGGPAFEVRRQSPVRRERVRMRCVSPRA